MMFTRYILIAVLLATAFQGICMERNRERNMERNMERNKRNSPQFIHYVPKEKSYSMDIREVHECVACHSDQRPRNDFLRCLRLLSKESKNLAKQCCENIYDGDFCKNASGGKIDFDRICHDPSKAVQVNRCFWKTTNTAAKDVVAYKQCRKKIIDGFCTTRTGY